MSENTNVPFDTVVATVETGPMTFQRLHDGSVRLFQKEPGGTIFRQFRYLREEWMKIVVGLEPEEKAVEAPAESPAPPAESTAPETPEPAATPAESPHAAPATE